MNDNFVYLTIYQGFALVNEIDELKKNPYFRDAIAEDFTKEVFTRAKKITVNSLNDVTNIFQKFQKKWR